MDNGQGLLDAAAAAKPIAVSAFAPNAGKSAITESLCQRGGAVRATTPGELEKVLTNWFADETSRKLTGNAALAVSREIQSTIHKTVDMILEHLDRDELYVAPEQEPAAV